MNTLFRVIGGSIGPVLGSVILAGFMVSWNPPGSPASVMVEIASETGYVWAWTVGAICAIIGMIAALVFRSTEGSSFTETPEGSPAATQE
jgi:MFS family permease